MPDIDQTQPDQNQVAQPDPNEEMVSNTPSNSSDASSTPVASASVAQTPATVTPAPQPSQAAQIAASIDSTPNASHPAVKKASLLHDVAESLAGGPRYTTTIDPTTGATTRTAVPLTGRQIGMAIALEAINGSLAGFGVPNGPGNLGRAAAAGAQTTVQAMQQASAAQQQQAQADAKQKSDALVRAANVADINSRTILSTAEARGADTLAKIAATNKPLIDSYDEEGSLQARQVTQQELLAGMQSGKYNITDTLGPIDGYRLVGGGRVEATHAVISDPSALVPLTNDQYEDYSNNHVQGFPKKDAPIVDKMIPGTIIARANEQKTMFQLAQARHDEVADALRQSDDPKVQAMADNVPSIGELLDNPKTGAGLATALTRFQSYVSHADISHGGRDLYESLQQMAQPSRTDPNDPKKTISNKDAPFANQVANAFGGWNVLQAYHAEVEPEQITNEGQAADMIASSEPGSRAYLYAQRWIQSDTNQKAAIARAGAQARESVKPPSLASLIQPDAFGNVPTVTDAKEASKRFGAFKKNLDSLSQTEQTYNQFQSIANDVKAGKLTGAESVVALLSAVGISAAPLKGNGFRVSKDILNEHKNARGWEQSMQQKFLGATDGDVITPKQILDYSNIAANARTSQYVNVANQMRNAGLSVDPALPSSNGQKIDPATAQIFMSLAGNDPQKARAAAAKKGWSF
jgi:hypothetical protein